MAGCHHSAAHAQIAAPSRELVTFSLEGSPFSVLETFCTAYDLDGRAWSIRPSDDDDVVARSYSALNAKVKLGCILDGIQKLAKAPAIVKFDEK